MGTFTAPRNAFLEFEEGPTTDVVLQWGTYYDAADQAGISRIYGGIHVPADDGPGRVMGSVTGILAWDLARKYFDGSIRDEPLDLEVGAIGESVLRINWNTTRGAYYKVQKSSSLMEGFTEDVSGWFQASETMYDIELPSGTPDGFFRVIR